MSQPVAARGRENVSLRRDLRRVVVIASSSRGGSSLFAEMLRAAPVLGHFPGEVNHHFRRHGLTWPEQDSDAVAAGALFLERRAGLDRDLTEDAGQPTREWDEAAFARRLTHRLALQWPDLRFDADEVADWSRRARAALGWGPDAFRDAAAFHAAFLREVRAHHPAVNPYYYDLPPDRVARWCPEAPVPAGPPADRVGEEPPFVTVGPWRSPAPAEWADLPLVVKTPSNAYRMDALRACFPAAAMQVVHLTRNAAAAVNGLYDGWLHHGFFSNRLPSGTLAIAGYSDRFPEWGRQWWKFDLPPGWREWTHRRLEEVCAFQWMAAHRAILQDQDAHPEVPVLRVRFEDVVGSRERRRAAFARVAEFLGAALEVSGDLRQPVMATRDPRPGRWRERAALLAPVLRRADVREMMERLGYGDDPDTWE